MKEKHWNSTIFQDNTALDKTMYSDLTGNTGRKFSKRTVVTICVALGLDWDESEKLLGAMGHKLILTDRAEFAYFRIIKSAFDYLIENGEVMSIYECNEQLSEWSIEEKHHLGSKI